MDKYEAYEKFDELEETITNQFNRFKVGKQPKLKNNQKRPTVILKDLSDFNDDVAEWVPTYAAGLDPQHHERQWLIDSLAPFYRENLITDVIRLVKGGKEANVYCCIAHPTLNVPLVAAKLYRPRALRTLKNDAVYKAGRQLRDEEGKLVKGRRERLALAKKTRFGKHLDMVWWIGNEYNAQKKLYDVGADVPHPIAHIGNTILMEYIGDDRMPAPTLIDVTLPPHEAEALFDIVLGNIKLMLDNHFVHGDLSPYNILYQIGEVTIIDFPQLVDARSNPNALVLFRRDVRRICDYFQRYGVHSDPDALVSEIWEPYMGTLD